MRRKSPTGRLFVPYTGRTLGKYKVREMLSRDRMGDVYRAFDPDAEHEVAIKVLNGDCRDLDRFEGILKVTTTLKHPNILRMFDYGIAEGVPYAVTELVKGTTLRDALSARRGGLDPDQAVEIMWHLTKALAYAHKKEVIHGNIKPANIIMQPGGDPLLTGFGLTQALDMHMSVWVPTYLSPEQAAGAPPTAQSDLYALGVVFYEMVTGRTPFVSDSVADVLQKHLEEQPKMPTEVGANISHQVEAVIMWMLAKDPNMRPSAARKVLETLGPEPGEEKYTTFALKRSAASEFRDAVVAESDASQTEENRKGQKSAPKFKRLLGWLRRDRTKPD